MPIVNGKHFPYNKSGRMAAKRVRKVLGANIVRGEKVGNRLTQAHAKVAAGKQRAAAGVARANVRVDQAKAKIAMGKQRLDSRMQQTHSKVSAMQSRVKGLKEKYLK